jgi:hypothetical protein
VYNWVANIKFAFDTLETVKLPEVGLFYARYGAGLFSQRNAEDYAAAVPRALAVFDHMMANA